MRLGVFVVAVVAGAAFGCKKEASAPKTLVPPANATAAARASQSHGAAAQASSKGELISGTIAETMDAGGYTYLKLDTAQGEVWAAIKQTKVNKGDRAEVGGAMLMTNFKSPTLNRVFDRIYFGTLGQAEAKPVRADSPHGSNDPGMVAAMHGRMATTDKAALGKAVAKAEGPNAHRIAELYAASGKLKDQRVRVRGQVVKFTPAIMGRNWVHLQDGSGTREGADYDLTVTTQEGAKVGDQVVVEGLLRVGRDFGAGYAYPVIVEEATVKTAE